LAEQFSVLPNKRWLRTLGQLDERKKQMRKHKSNQELNKHKNPVVLGSKSWLVVFMLVFFGN
jgi:hypothetical protein